MKNEWKTQYYEEFRKFVGKMNQLENEHDPKIENILEGVCSLLGISKIRVWFYETPMKEAMGQGDFIELYGTSLEPPDETYSQFRYVTGGGNVVRYDVYAQDEESAWTEQQEAEINTLVNTIFSYHGKIRTKRIADRLTFWDDDFGLKICVTL